MARLSIIGDHIGMHRRPVQEPGLRAYQNGTNPCRQAKLFSLNLILHGIARRTYHLLVSLRAGRFGKLVAYLLDPQGKKTSRLR
jgi:hypothetical protein